MCLIWTCKKHMFTCKTWTVQNEQCDMGPYRAVGLHTFSMEHVQSCTITGNTHTTYKKLTLSTTAPSTLFLPQTIVMATIAVVHTNFLRCHKSTVYEYYTSTFFINHLTVNARENICKRDNEIPFHRLASPMQPSRLTDSRLCACRLCFACIAV